MSSNKLVDKAYSLIISDLKGKGRRIVDECLISATYNHQTYNLHDSYGCAIYKFGILVYKYTPPQTASEKHPWGYGPDLSGAEEIEKFFQGYNANPTAIELVVAAAMPYAEYLEKGWTMSGKKYKVVSMAYDKLKKLCGSYKGATVSTILHGQKISG